MVLRVKPTPTRFRCRSILATMCDVGMESSDSLLLIDDNVKNRHAAIARGGDD